MLLGEIGYGRAIWLDLYLSVYYQSLRDDKERKDSLTQTKSTALLSLKFL